jgi:hypothetical protein
MTKVASLTAAALAIAALASAATARQQAPLLKLPRAAQAGQQTQFGHIGSLTRAARTRYILRFDPAEFLTGYTAARAKFADTGSSDLPNDYYIVDETHRLLSYVVPPGTRVTVLTRGTNTTTVSVADLARRVRAGTTRGAGFWLLIGNRYPTPVLSIDQQFQP